MTANTSPLFTLTPNIAVGQTIATANTAKDGTGTVVTVYTAGANNGVALKVVFQPLGTNVQTVARVFINNGGTNATASNNSYHADVTLPATTLSETASMPKVELVLNTYFPAGYKINLTIGTTVAAGYAVQCISQDF